MLAEVPPGPLPGHRGLPHGRGYADVDARWFTEASSAFCVLSLGTLLFL